jgi:hypothetical protein
LDTPVALLLALSQLLGLHVTFCHSWQLPLPSHMPLRMHVLMASGPHVGWFVPGAAPAAMLVQVPAVPARLHA